VRGLATSRIPEERLNFRALSRQELRYSGGMEPSKSDSLAHVPGPVSEEQQPPISTDERRQRGTTNTSEEKLGISNVELLSKASALLLVLLYAFGFMIVSLSDAQCGILQFNLLKPRIFASGALFGVLIAIPVVAIRRVRRRSLVPEQPGQEWDKASFDGNRYFNMCIILAAVSYGVLWSTAPHDVGMLSQLPPIKSAIFFLTVFADLSATRAFLKYHKTDPSISRFLPTVSFVLANVIVLYVFGSWKGFVRIVYWFFGVGLYASWLEDRFRDSKKRARLYLELLLMFAVTFTALYARFIYGGLNSSLGGGAMPPLTLYLAQRVPSLPGIQEHVLLIDETDMGFYVLQNASDRQAVFIPRNYVISVKYGE
jgi:hypothetical protein